VAVKIDEIREMLSKAGGIAFSNTFKVSFEEDQRGTSNKSSNIVFDNLKNAMPGFVKGDLTGDKAEGGPGRWVSMMCDDAVLPGSQAATGQINGLYTGSGTYNYPHTRIYNDLTLSWIGDANMTPLKFVNTWMNTIFNDEEGPTKLQARSRDVKKRSRNRSIRLNYMDEYTMQISILKAEKGPDGELDRPSVRYVIEGAFPYSIDSVPLSYGSSTLIKISANFYYERWYEYYTDQWGKVK
jgi:hypothetical protein